MSESAIPLFSARSHSHLVRDLVSRADDFHLFFKTPSKSSICMATRRKNIISEGHFRILQSALRIGQSNSSSVLRITCSYYGSPFRPGNKTETVLVTRSDRVQHAVTMYFSGCSKVYVYKQGVVQICQNSGPLIPTVHSE